MALSANLIGEMHTPVKGAIISKGGPRGEAACLWSLLQQQDEALEVTRLLLEVKRNDIFGDIDDTQPPVPSEAAGALIDSQAHPGVTIPDELSDTALLRFREIAVPSEDRRWVADKSGGGQGPRLIIGIGALLMALVLGWLGESLYQHFDRRDELTGQAAMGAVVERIIAAESNGDPNLKDSHSSATGLGQFLDDTWLELIRQYRPDLTKGRSDSETLELRREAKLAHEITMRFVERNAAILKNRGLPVTAGAIYLAHFAGPAGAVAILSASENADAALVMASADTTGRTSRDQLIKANPFLEHFTVADLKVWADRKMRGPDPRPTNVRTAQVKR
jgi:hypothetical protein